MLWVKNSLATLRIEEGRKDQVFLEDYIREVRPSYLTIKQHRIKTSIWLKVLPTPNLCTRQVDLMHVMNNRRSDPQPINKAHFTLVSGITF